jgi:hypothetical protein
MMKKFQLTCGIIRRAKSTEACASGLLSIVVLAEAPKATTERHGPGNRWSSEPPETVQSTSTASEGEDARDALSELLEHAAGRDDRAR